jgi:hypothetical protein
LRNAPLSRKTCVTEGVRDCHATRISFIPCGKLETRTEIRIDISIGIGIGIGRQSGIDPCR